MSDPKQATIAVEKLEFDPENPRLSTDLRPLHDEALLKHFILKENIFELMSSICQQGYVSAEPLLVVERASGIYTVVEGNRRLASLKLLNNPKLATVRQSAINEIVCEAAVPVPTSVPVLIYEKREDILDYLGYRHVTGVERWDSLAKARYLKQLYDIHKQKTEASPADVYKILAKTIGSRTDYIQKLLKGYFLYCKIQDEDYYDIPNLNDKTFQFSLLTTAISYNNIADHVGIVENESSDLDFNPDHLKELTLWLFKEVDGASRVPESRALKDLNAVVAKEQALKVFREGKPLDYATRFTDAPLELFNKAIEDATKLIDVADSQFFLIEDVPSTTLDNVSHLQTKGFDLWTKVKGRKQDPKVN
jgi:hypothetical protein